MKKIIALLLVAILCFSLASCGNKDKEKYEKYDELIQLLEEEKYQEAIAEINKLAESNEKNDGKETETINITIDNWQEYFETKFTVREEYNDFDEIETIWVYNSLCVKAEWKNIITELDVAFDYSCKDGYSSVVITYNMDTKELSFVETETTRACNDSTNKTVRIKTTADKSLYFTSNSGKAKVEDNIVTITTETVYHTIEVNRVQGSIVIEK